MGEDRAEEFGQRNAMPGELLVRVTPERVIADADVAVIDRPPSLDAGRR